MINSKIKIEDARNISWRTLGVRMSGNPKNKAHAEKLGKDLSRVIMRIRRQNLEMEEIGRAIEALWASRIQYGAACYIIEEEELWKHEKEKTKAIRTANLQQ